MYKLILFLLLIPTVTAQIEITEIMYDLDGADSGREWIEIHNTGESINISNYRFYEADTNHKLKIFNQDLVLEPDEYAVIVDKPELYLENNPNEGTIIDSTFGLSNSGEYLAIKDSKNGNITSKINYTAVDGADGTGSSLQFYEGEWKACSPTPTEENYCTDYVEPAPEPEPEQETETENEPENTTTEEQPEIIEEINTTVSENNSKITNFSKEPKLTNKTIETKLVKRIYESQNRGYVIIAFYLFLLSSITLNLVLLIFQK